MRDTIPPLRKVNLMSEPEDNATTFEIPAQIKNDPRIGHLVYHGEGGCLGTIIDVLRFKNGEELVCVADINNAVVPYGPENLIVE
jgi:hypothetical protein